MEINFLTTTALGIGFSAVAISLVMAFRALIKRKQKNLKTSLNTFLNKDSFTHIEFKEFATTELGEVGSFDYLRRKFLVPLINEGVLQEKRQASDPKYRRSVSVIYEKK